jgi:hypothetical protein
MTKIWIERFFIRFYLTFFIPLPLPYGETEHREKSGISVLRATASKKNGR